MGSDHLVNEPALKNLLQRHREVCDAAAAIAITKMAQRGSDNLLEQGELGVAIRVFLDKGQRAIALARCGEHIDVDDILDVINYAVFLLFLGEDGGGPLAQCRIDQNK